MSSKKLRAAQGGGSEDLKVDMSPMIDMVFLLLIFFLVMDAIGVVPKIHLRGDKDSMFKYSRRVIRSAAAAGVNEVIFVSYAKDPGN